MPQDYTKKLQSDLSRQEDLKAKKTVNSIVITNGSIEVQEYITISLQ